MIYKFLVSIDRDTWYLIAQYTVAKLGLFIAICYCEKDSPEQDKTLDKPSRSL